MKKVSSFFLNLFLFAVFPAGAFWGGFRLTDTVFRLEKVPFPFEYFGVAVGGGFFFWALATVIFVKSRLKNRRV